MIDLNFKYKELFSYLKNEIKIKPDISIVLGSGLGNFADSLNIIQSFETKKLPGYPSSTVVGHSGKIFIAEYSSINILLFSGRIHFYEGYKISECILPAFLSFKLGCKKLLLTNAAGGINYSFSPGDLMLANSFNGISIKKELTNLIGVASEESKKFLNNFPSKKLNDIINDAALDVNVNLKEGVYYFTKGPSYETPAEIRMLRKLGCDAVGMSTVHEAVFAASKGVETSAISCITNMAAGISETALSHSEVTETANKVRREFANLLKSVIRRI